MDGFRNRARPARVVAAAPASSQAPSSRPVKGWALWHARWQVAMKRAVREWRVFWARDDAKSKRMHWVAVTVFSLSFFGSLFSVLIKPPAAHAAIELGDGITIYGVAANTTPKFRNYIESTDTFGTATNTQSNAVGLSYDLKTSPIKTEAIAAYYIAGGTMQVMCFDGTTWSNEWTATVTNQANARPFNVAYEQTTGNVVILYGNGGTSNELSYRTKTGTTGCGAANWSSATTVESVRTTGAINWVEVKSNPTNNTLAAIWGDTNRDLSGMIWNSTNSTWGNEPSAAFSTTLDTVSSTTYQDVEAFDLEFESLTGNLMVVWGLSGTGTNHIGYQQCTGGGASCTWQTSSFVPTVSDAGTMMDMAANPKTNEIVFGAVESGDNDMSIGYWSGSAWTGTQNVDTTCEIPTQGNKLVTANWLINGATTKSFIVYADRNSQAVDYVTGVGGTMTVQTDFTPTPLPSTTTRYYKTRKDPFHLNRVMLEFTDSNNDLFAKHAVMDAAGAITWSNSDGGTALEANTTSSTGGPFGFAYWQNVPTPAPPKINQDGYIWENDDEDQVGGDAVDSSSGEAPGNTAITGVKRGERLTLRTQIRNTGVEALGSHVGLFYDRNDGYFSKVKDHAPPITAAGSCTDTAYSCGVVDNAAGTTTGQYSSMAFDRAGNAWVSYYDGTAAAQGLWVAKYVGVGGTGCGASGSTAWTCTAVDKAAATDLGQYTSIGFDKTGTPWISYYDVTNTNLKVAKLRIDGTTGSGCGASGSTLWDCVTVDNTANASGTFSSIAFDQSGNPGVAYTFDTGATKGVKYANYVGASGTGCATATWKCTVVDNGSATGIDYTSVQFAHDNKPWIAYYDKTNTALNVANYVGGTNGTGCGAGGSTAWTCSQVDNNADDGSYASLMFGPTGQAWVSYYDVTSTELKVATNGGGYGSTCTDAAWTCGAVDNTGTDTGKYTSLAQDASGQVIVSYYDTTNTSMRVARYVGGSSGNCTDTGWNCSAVDNTGTDTGQYTSAAVAPDGNLWVSFYDVTNTALRTTNVSRGGEIYPAAGLAGLRGDAINVSHADTVAVTSMSSTADCLTAGANWSNGTWASGGEASGFTLAIGNIVGQCTELAYTIDTSQAVAGRTYRFIIAAQTSDRLDKGVWRGPASVAVYATLTIESNTTIRNAKDTNPRFTNCADTAWGCASVQSANSVGTYTSLAFDPGGNAWMTYYDATNTALIVARYVGSGGTGCATAQWNCITMESTGTTGQYNSIAFDNDGIPWISYFDSTNGRLKVAHYVGASGSGCASAAWTCESIDGGPTGQYTSIAFSPSGTPWVSYYNQTVHDLYIAMYVGAGGTGCSISTAWTCYPVDNPTEDSGQYSSLGFDGNGVAWISYYDNTSFNLKVAEYVGAGGSGCISNQWTCTQVDTGGTTGQYTSISFDSTGKPWVSYYDSTNSALNVAKYVSSGGSGCASAAWTCTQVDNTAADGQYSSIAFDAYGNAWVSYYESGGGDLRVAHFVTSSGAGCTSAAWTCTSVATTSTVGQYSAIAFDHSGTPWVSYSDAGANNDAKIAKLNMPLGKPTTDIVTAGARSARTADGRFRLDSGYSPRPNPNGCGSVANDMGACGVLSDDSYFDAMNANANEQPFFTFATRFANNTTAQNVKWAGMSTVAASTSALTLEVYRFGSTNAWETIVTNAACSANTECGLYGSPAGTLSEYYDSDGAGNYWIYYRVSQAAGASAESLLTNVFQAAPTTDQLLRHGQWFDPNSAASDLAQPFFWAQ